MNQNKLHRRGFLKKSAAMTAAGVAVPYFLNSAAAQSAEAKKDKLNIAAIGVGGRGAGISMDAARYGNMVACADVDSGAAEKFAKQLDGKCDLYTDYRKILERPDIDVIICGTPDHWHTKIAIETLKAGKHIYCEKPLTLTIGESKLICQAAKQSDKIFQVGTQQRTEFNRMFLKAVAIARSGRLGDKLHALASVNTATRGEPPAFKDIDPPSTLDWDFWLGQAPKSSFCPKRIGWDFRWWLSYSGGQVTDWGAHHMDIAMWALGGDKTGAIEADGQGEFPLFNADYGINDANDIIDFLNGKKNLPAIYNVAWCFDCDYLLPNGNTIHLTSGNDKTNKDDRGKNEIIIQGDKGKIRVNRGGLTGKLINAINADESEKKWLDEEVAKIYRNMPLKSHMANFFHCIETGELPISDVFTHCNAMNACHMANISMMLKRKLKWDPEKYEFIGDDEANLLTRRAQREPYAIKV
jgi:myo-inositol 2-dehydrogenase / D-chiro-inositol 1-dehydrogenase